MSKHLLSIYEMQISKILLDVYDMFYGGMYGLISRTVGSIRDDVTSEFLIWGLRIFHEPSEIQAVFFICVCICVHIFCWSGKCVC